MSERGSFITEYMYCEKCFNAVKEILLSTGYNIHPIVIPWSSSEHLPIIAGKIGGLYSGEELVHMEYDIVPKIEKKICHNVRIAVLAECGEKIFTAHPEKDQPQSETSSSSSPPKQ